MAAQNNRTVSLTLAANTTGRESVTALADELKKLASQGGEAAPEFARLAAELEKASDAEQQQAKAARTAANNMQAAKQSMLEARAAMSSYTASIGGAKGATAEQVAQLAKLNQTIRDSKAGYDQARVAVAAITPEYNRLAAATRGVVAESERLTAAVKAPGEAAGQSAGKIESAFTGMLRSARSFAGGLAAFLGVDEFIRANTSVEALRRTLEQMTGSTAGAAKEIEYLRTTANRLGLDVNDAGRAYTNLTAAAKGTALEGQGTKAIFEAVAGAMSKLGKSSADTEGALQAVAQMMSKGVVSQEEMRQQLGERLPGAMQAAADATGVTVGELNQMIGTGQVLASDLLPKLAEGLQKMYGTAGQAEGMVSSWNRLKNAVSETFTFIGESGVVTALVGIMGQLGYAVRGLTGAFELLGKIIGITFGAIASFDFKHPIDSIRNWKTAVGEAADDIQKKMDAVKGSAEKTGDAQTKLAATTTEAARAAEGQTVSWLAVVNAYSKVNTAAKEAVDLAVKSAAAKAEEGKAAVALAQAFGTETEKREAAQQSANDNTVALKAVAAARRIEAEAANSNAVALAEAAKGEAVLSEEKRKAIQAAQDNAAAKKAEADQSSAAALASQQHAAQLTTEAAALQDNSGRVLELKAAHEAAVAALENVRQARRAGIATLDDEQAAAIAAGQAAALYRDALGDQTRKIEENAKAKQLQTNVDQAGVRLAIEQQRTIHDLARARGDEYTATQATIEIKRLEIKLSEITAKAKAAEAESMMLTVKAKRAELEASNQLTPAKEAELKALELSAQAKQIEAQIAGETAARVKELTEQVILSGEVAGGAAGNYDRLSGSLDGVKNSADGAKDAIDRVNSAGSNSSGIGQRAGGGNSGGNPENTRQERAGSVSAQQFFQQKILERGLDIETSKAALDAVGMIYQQEIAKANKSGFSGATDYTTKLRLAEKTAIERAIAEASKTPGKQPPTDTAHPSSVRVDINIGRQSQSVNVASPSDAETLKSLFKSLESDLNRAG